MSPEPITEPDKIYITETGKKYHKGTCRYLSKSAIEITKEEAANTGYGPCSVCLPAPKPDTNPSDYYITNTGEKYHRGGCRYLSSSAIPVSLADAQSRGYGACKVCIGSSSTTTKKSYATSGRCLATTKKGTQCKRTSKAGSGYCWQHGG